MRFCEKADVVTSDTPSTEDVEVPRPLIERGDFVRLKQPREISPEARVHLRAALHGIVSKRAEAQGDQEVRRLSRENIGSARHYESYEDIFEVSHGIVVDILSRFNTTRGEVRGGSNISNKRKEEHLEKRVSLHLFNPEIGLMWVGEHPTETGGPMNIDLHINELLLIQKHDLSWGECEIDIAEQYGKWGIQGVGIPPEKE
jgi:hypothetical protein